MVYPSQVPARPLRTVDPPPATVWTALAIEQQEQVIRLLAQLACTFASTPAVLPKEPDHADPLPRH